MQNDSEEEERREQIDLGLEEIDRYYQSERLITRLRMIGKGLKAPRKSKEYKEGMIELQRLSAPVAALLIPILAVLVMFLLSSPSQMQERVIETQIFEAETVEDLEELPDTEPPPDLQQDIQTSDLNIDTLTPAITVETTAPITETATPKPVSIDTVMQVKSPVILRNIYGTTRSAGTRGSAIARFGGSAKTEASVMRALRWIKSQQEPSGRWKGRGDGTSVTGFAILAFLAHGETPGNSEEFGDTVQRGIEYLMTQKHHDSMATHALAEAYGMTQNPNIKKIAERSLNQMADRLAKTKWGPSRDGDGTTRPNLLNMAFNVMALRSAKLSQIAVTNMEPAFKKLKEGFLVQGNKTMGGFSSDHFGPPGENYRRTGMWHFIVGVVGMQYLGAGSDPIVEKTLELLDDEWEPPTLGSTDIACCPVRGNYWATMVFFNQGDKRWAKWNRMMQDVYVKGQTIVKDLYKDPQGKPQELGYWTCEDMHIGEQPLMPTCYVAQQLMVYYRYLPTSSKEVWNSTKEVKEISSIDENDITVDIGVL